MATKAQGSLTIFKDTYATWCHVNDKTLINGSKIYTGSIGAKQIDVDDLFAQSIKAKNMLITGDSAFDGKIVVNYKESNNDATASLSMGVQGLESYYLSLSGEVEPSLCPSSAYLSVPCFVIDTTHGLYCENLSYFDWLTANQFSAAEAHFNKGLFGSVQTNSLDVYGDLIVGGKNLSEEIVYIKSLLGGGNGGTNETNTPYVKAEAMIVANKIAGSAGTFKMVFITDLHNMDDPPRLEHANQAIQLLCRMGDIDCVVFGGDYIRNWTEVTKEEAVEDIEQCRNKFKNQVVPAIWLRGNHDTNGYVGERISKEEAYNLIANKNVENGAVINNADPYGNYGYVDFADKKVRLIFVNTSDNDFMGLKAVSDPANTADHISCHNVSATQLQWIADNALSFTESGWKVIFVSHLPLYWSTGSSPAWYNSHTYTDDNGNKWTCNLSNMGNMIKAYINKTSFSATLNGETASKNFSTLSYYAEIANGINGHQHAFLTNTDGLVNYISVGNACEGGKTSEDGKSYPKVDNTADDTAFNVIDFDFVNDVAYCWNYGAGYDRVIPFRYAASVFVVNNALTNVTSSNTTLTITEGTSYTTTLTANDGFKIDSVIVKMGGVDITSTAYTNGVITIAEVTGDIIITAVAVKDGYTNIIDTIGYTDGVRLNSSGTTTALSGYTTTGTIDVSAYAEPVTIRTDNVDFTYSNSCYLVGYNADGSKLAYTYIKSLVENGVEWNGIFVTADDEGNIVIEVRKSSAANYYRITGYGSGANLIVTINEEITD